MLLENLTRLSIQWKVDFGGVHALCETHTCTCIHMLYVRILVGHSQVEQMYRDAHAKIRADPTHVKKPPKEKEGKPKRWALIGIIPSTMGS